MHIPVLQKEVLQYLNPKPNENFIDATYGEGGHTLAILERNGPRGKILGIDWEIRVRYKNERLILVQDNFANLKEIVEKYKFQPVQGILFDLGLSSWHLEKSGRGFSFKKREPLDMRYSLENKLCAEKIVNYWSKFDIEKILREYGQERKAKRVAEKIIEERKIKPIKTTVQLREIINKARTTPRRTFQALRIAVNDELENLKKVLPQALEILEPGGRLVIISFHSLEDRIVKNFLKGNQNLLQILTKKPIGPTQTEIKINPRSRSAKLRATIKL
ncbi:MAG: 16S rRNA (cytosine(1402)-N(4))-methyltransferase RsmH [Patescibacteria group bacterium]|nr:16S rRNA (cytosine(1402)-N(4))-methyltransferase RsmH [Patescibacteria group bacterium]